MGFKTLKGCFSGEKEEDDRHKNGDLSSFWYKDSKFNQKAKVYLKDKGEIYIRIEKNNSKINIYLEDNGSGMVKSSFVKIFNPGFTTKERGWGLGLSLSKRIIEDYHSGEIKVLKSELNVGTTFLITLNGRKWFWN